MDMKLDILNTAGSTTGKQIELPAEVFGIEPNDHAIYLAVKQHLANKRQGTHKAKPRNEVKGSTKKIKRQKGTGTARAGDIKNPLFRGGGRIFGPEPRDYSFKLNKKVKELARKSALTYKAQEEAIRLLENFTFEAPKTAQVVALLNALQLEGKKVTIVMGDTDANVILSARNIPGVAVESGSNLHTYEILHSDVLVFTEAGLEALEGTFKATEAA